MSTSKCSSYERLMEHTRQRKQFNRVLADEARSLGELGCLERIAKNGEAHDLIVRHFEYAWFHTWCNAHWWTFPAYAAVDDEGADHQYRRTDDVRKPTKKRWAPSVTTSHRMMKNHHRNQSTNRVLIREWCSFAYTDLFSHPSNMDAWACFPSCWCLYRHAWS